MAITYGATRPQPTLPQIPADGIEFELTLDPIALPLEMTRKSELHFAKHRGRRITKPQTQRFKLVRVGDCKNLKEVQSKLKKRGKLAEGKWQEAFRKTYPINDGIGPIGFADGSWINQNRGALFPALFLEKDSWRPIFACADLTRHAHWRWLVKTS